jgi:hypothetical protein
VVHVVAIGNDLEELREVEEERVASRADEDLNAALERRDFSERERPGLTDERIGRSDFVRFAGNQP